MTEVLQKLDRSIEIPRDVSSGFRNRIFVVIGMHRSGTSLCSNILTLLGVDMASELSANAGNPKGHFERWDIVALHDEILDLFDRGYFSDTHDYPLPSGWWADIRLQAIKERLKTCLSAAASRSFMFGFKDPRTTKLIPLWNQVFIELQLDPHFIICVRNPVDVAISLKTRESLETEIGELRCIDYVVDAIRYTKERRRVFIMYHDWFVDPEINTKKLFSFVGPPAIPTMQDLQLAVENVASPDLNRSGRVGSRSSQPLVRYLFQKLAGFVEANGEDPALESEIDTFSQNYVSFRQLLGPFERNLRKATTNQQALEKTLAEFQEIAKSNLQAAHQKLEIVQSSLDTERAALAVSQQYLSELEAKLEEAEAANLSLEKRLAEIQATSNSNLQAAHQGSEIVVRRQRA